MNPQELKRFIPNSLRFWRDYLAFKRLSEQVDGRFTIKPVDVQICLYDNVPTTPFPRHYLYHPAWAARVLARTMPEYHVDISSSLYFVAIASAFVPIRSYDYRPANINLSGLSMGRADLMGLDFEDSSVPSISCMHTVEHIGLGRYGDKLDPEGDLKAIKELKRVVAKGGDLLFVVPVGHPRICYNAHRIYSNQQVLEYFKGMELMECALIAEKDGGETLILNPGKDAFKNSTYDCGCYWFRKPK